MSLQKSAALVALLAAAGQSSQPARAADGDRSTIRPAIYQSRARENSAPVQLVRYGRYGGYRRYGGYGYRTYGGYRPYYGYRGGYYGSGVYSPFGYGLGLGYGLGSLGYGYGGYGYGYGYIEDAKGTRRKQFLKGIFNI